MVLLLNLVELMCICNLDKNGLYRKLVYFQVVFLANVTVHRTSAADVLSSTVFIPYRPQRRLPMMTLLFSFVL